MHEDWWGGVISWNVNKFERFLPDNWRHFHIRMRMRTRHVGLRQMRTNAKKLLVQHSLHKRTSKCSAGYSLAARMSVHPHQYDCKRIFLWSTDFRQITFTCSPNIRCISECYSPTHLHYAVYVRFCVQMWMRIENLPILYFVEVFHTIAFALKFLKKRCRLLILLFIISSLWAYNTDFVLLIAQFIRNYYFTYIIEREFF